MKYLVLLIWNLTLLIGTTYLVFWKGHSGWWFLFMLILFWSLKEKEI